MKEGFMNTWVARVNKYQKTGSCTQIVIIISCALSLSIGFLEISMVSILTTPTGFSSFPLIFPSLAGTTGLFFLTYLLLWYLVVSPIGRFFKLEALPLALSLAVFGGMFFTLALLNNQVQLPQSPTAFFKFLILVSFSLFMSISVYVTIKAVAPLSGSRNITRLFSLAAPFVLAETMIFVWAYMYRMKSFLSVPFFLSSVIYMLMVLSTMGLLYRLGKKVKVITWLAVFTILVVLSPLVTVIAMRGSTASLRLFKTTDHQIKHVILIIDDTLRPDFLSCYHSESVSTPHIDQLARDGILFTKAISAAPWTLPSVASIMTGLAPSVHKAIRKDSKLPDSVRTVAEYMRDAGYYTAAIGRNPILTPKLNISQGFLDYNFFPKSWVGDTLGMRLFQSLFPNQFRSDASTSDLTRLIIQWLELNDEKDFFLWIHYFDPHHPYAPPAEFLPPGDPSVSIGKSFSSANVTKVRRGYLVPSLEERAWVRELYAAEVRYVDENLGKLLETLKRLNLYDESLIIFTSDHGEEFWEHDSCGHGHTLYNEVLWVPLIIKLPQSLANQQISIPVPTQGIMPTILDLCGIDYEHEYLSVASLTPLWDPKANPFNEQPILSTGLSYYEDRESVMFDGLKYIRSFLTHREDLYDLVQDPEEQRSIMSLAPDKVQRARDLLKDHNQRAEALREHYRMTSKEEIQLDQETIQQLKSLGYIQ